MKPYPDSAFDLDRSWSRWLFASLLVSLLILPLFEELYAGQALLLVGHSITLTVAALATRSKLRMLALTMLVVALPTSWATLFVDSPQIFVVHCLLASAVYWVTGGVIVLFVIRSHQVTIDSVFAALSAYLLFGLAWALTYWGIYTVAPDAFSSITDKEPFQISTDRSAITFSHFIYYSFVTMSTLGYGDITPIDRITRTLSWVQSVTGQFYVAVIIAWLISALPQPTREAK
jgi:hypothetical protein